MNRQCDIFSDKMPWVGITTEDTENAHELAPDSVGGTEPELLFPEQEAVDHHEGDDPHDHGDDHSRGYQSDGVHGTKVIVPA